MSDSKKKFTVRYLATNVMHMVRIYIYPQMPKEKKTTAAKMNDGNIIFRWISYVLMTAHDFFFFWIFVWRVWLAHFSSLFLLELLNWFSYSFFTHNFDGKAWRAFGFQFIVVNGPIIINFSSAVNRQNGIGCIYERIASWDGVNKQYRIRIKSIDRNHVVQESYS